VNPLTKDITREENLYFKRKKKKSLPITESWFDEKFLTRLMEKISSSLRRHTHEQVFDPFSPPKRRIRG
jgi:hypothetical protein